LENDLAHARAAYIFSIQSLPDPALLSRGAIKANGMEFRKESEIFSMRVELGWAFFCRYEACLEFHLKKNNVTLSKKLTLLEWFDQKNTTVPEKHKLGIERYRLLRNKLHHENGASLDGPSGSEIHLLPEQMENFYNLFIWCGNAIKNAG
jgi:hypothetical protein